MERREIQDFPGYYIYEDGCVWSDPKGTNFHGRFLKQTLDKSGYVVYDLCGKGNKCRRKAHRLVLEAFVGSCSEGMECRHLDGDPQNNHVSNLCWGTHKRNMADMVMHGTDSVGERNGFSKLISIEVMEIRDLLASGLYFQREIAEMYGISHQQVSRINTGKRWRCIGWDR